MIRAYRTYGSTSHLTSAHVTSAHVPCPAAGAVPCSPTCWKPCPPPPSHSAAVAPGGALLPLLPLSPLPMVSSVRGAPRRDLQHVFGHQRTDGCECAMKGKAGKEPARAPPHTNWTLSTLTPGQGPPHTPPPHLKRWRLAPCCPCCPCCPAAAKPPPRALLLPHAAEGEVAAARSGSWAASSA